MTAHRAQLLAEVSAADRRSPGPGVADLIETVLARTDRRRVQAILFYGSELDRDGQGTGVHDFYMLVDHPRAAGQGRLAAALNRILPPNVVYVEARGPGGTTLRAKCAIVTGRQFARAARGRATTPLIWARFAQPCRLVYARDEASAAQVHEALADAVVSFHRKLLPLVPEQVCVSELWRRGLRDTYARELRSESAARADALWTASAASLRRRTRAALPLTGWSCHMASPDEVAVQIPARRRVAARAAASLARPWGKAASVLRLVKAAFTFEGAVDYVTWKIERHSGVRVEPTPFQRRHPLIAAWPLVWRIYRARGFR
jgi:hypothetical protein